MNRSSAAIVELEHGYHRIVGLHRRIDGFQGELGMLAGAALAATDIDQGHEDQKCGYQEITRLHDAELMVYKPTYF